MKVDNQTVALAELHSSPVNYNRHSPAQIDALARSLSTFGQPRSIVAWHNPADDRLYILAGHGVTEAARALGWETIRADVLTGYSEAEAHAYIVADNELARLADPDQAALAALLVDIQATDPALAMAAGFGPGELEALLRQVGAGAGGVDTEPQVDRAEELREKWGVSLGQMWACGEHRLIVGDCTDRATVERVLQGEIPQLMVTDPPYGVNYEPKWRVDVRGEGNTPTSQGEVSNDDCVDWSAAYSLVDVQVAYVWHAGRHASEVQRSLEASGYSIVCQIIWAKPIFALSRGDYHWKHEPCWYAVRKGYNHLWSGDRTQTTVWDIKPLHSYTSEDEHTGHGTQKPLECMERPIKNHNCQIVYDPFAGSGTTGIACHNLGRKARLIEIAPNYAAVCIERLYSHTGIEPVLLEAS